MLKIWSHVFQPTHLRRGGSNWMPFHGWSVKRGEGSWCGKETHCNHLHCWIRRTCHQRTGSTPTVYWRRWRVSVLGGRRRCLLMPGLAVNPWRRHQFVDAYCCWSWIPLRKWPAALIRRRCRVEKIASVRRCCCTGRRRRFVWFQQMKRNVGEEAWNVKGIEENRWGGEGKVSDFFYKGEWIRHAVGG